MPYRQVQPSSKRRLNTYDAEIVTVSPYTITLEEYRAGVSMVNHPKRTGYSYELINSEDDAVHRRGEVKLGLRPLISLDSLVDCDYLDDSEDCTDLLPLPQAVLQALRLDRSDSFSDPN